MHYYGTYAMARAAGINRNTAKIIATAAQFVDDNAEKDNIEFRDGARLDSEATAHHALNHKNIDPEDQRKIWVPFHFLPGNEGETYTERLVCRKDSEIAREMVQHMLSLANRSYAVPLMGITAHVYADTFAHYGFSGISSRRNKINKIEFDKIITQKSEKHLKQKEKEFKENYPGEGGMLTNIKAWFAEALSGALGLGAAVTFNELRHGGALQKTATSLRPGPRSFHLITQIFGITRGKISPGKGIPGKSKIIQFIVFTRRQPSIAHMSCEYYSHQKGLS